MVGSSLLVAPVLTKGATQVNVYFPGDTLWYDIWSHEKLDISGSSNYAAPYEKIPVFQRGGTIIPRRERVRRSAALMHDDPITLVVAPDREGKASGTLYLDDGQSFAYQQGAKLYIQFTWDNGKMQAKMISPIGMSTPVWLERVLVLGSAPASGQATVASPSGVTTTQATFDYNTKVLTIRRPGVKLDTEWTISV